MAITSARVWKFWGSAVISAVVLTGCGGGSSSAPSATLSGVAAVGNPIVGGTVSITCSGGGALGPVTTSSTGAWTVTLSGQTLPCAVQVSGGKIGSATGAANTSTYQSLATTAGTVNITPLTNLVVANLLGSASANLATLTPAQLSAITAAQVTAAISRVQTALNLSALSGANGINPITTAFNPTPGVVMDNLLSALATAITNAGTNYTAVLSAVGVAPTASIAPPAGLVNALSTAYGALPTSVSTGGGGSSTGGAGGSGNSLGTIQITAASNPARNGNYVVTGVSSTQSGVTSINGITADGNFEMQIDFNTTTKAIVRAHLWYFVSGTPKFFGCDGAIPCSFVSYEPIGPLIIMNTSAVWREVNSTLGVSGADTLVPGGETITASAALKIP